MQSDRPDSKLKALWTNIKSLWHKPAEGRHLTLKEMLAFGGSSLGVSFIFNSIGALITASQISEVYQIGVLHGPIICVTASLLGLILQPIYGKLLQNTNTRWGRYKPYILFMAPVISVLGILATWMPQNLSESARMIYAYCCCIPTLTLLTMWSNTFNMMPAVITPNQQERADVWSPIGLVMGFAPSLMNVLKEIIRGYYVQQGTEYMAYRLMGFISVAVGMLLVLFILKVKERIIQTGQNNEKVGLLEGMKMIFKNKPLIILTIALIAGCMRNVVDGDIGIISKLRFANTIDKGLVVFGSLTLVVGFAATPNMILLPFLTRKFNNKTIMMFWCATNVVGYLVLALVGVQNLPRGTVSAALITAMRFIAMFNAMGSLIPLMLSEIYDYQQWKTGKRLEGFIQTFAYSLVAVFTNIAILVMGFVKQGMGFEPKNYYNVTDVSGELMDTAMKYYNTGLWISLISAALMLIVMYFYRYSKKQHQEIIADLKAISLGETAAMDAAGGIPAEAGAENTASSEE